MEYFIYPFWAAIAVGLGVFGFACLMDPPDTAQLMSRDEFEGLLAGPPATPE